MPQVLNGQTLIKTASSKQLKHHSHKSDMVKTPSQDRSRPLTVLLAHIYVDTNADTGDMCDS
jgi:hypothetical protein